MFYDVFSRLCSKAGKAETRVCRDLGMSSNNPRMWKSGKTPKNETKLALAEYFGVDVSIFDETRSGHTPTTISSLEINAPRADELVLLSQYRELTAENKIKAIEYMELLILKQTTVEQKKTAL